MFSGCVFNPREQFIFPGQCEFSWSDWAALTYSWYKKSIEVIFLNIFSHKSDADQNQ